MRGGAYLVAVNPFRLAWIDRLPLRTQLLLCAVVIIFTCGMVWHIATRPTAWDDAMSGELIGTSVSALDRRMESNQRRPALPGWSRTWREPDYVEGDRVLAVRVNAAGTIDSCGVFRGQPMDGRERGSLQPVIRWPANDQ